MNAIPAKVAGVKELIMVVPTPGGEKECAGFGRRSVFGRVDRVFTIGGAQAVAALAYGTQTAPQVDKIVGPGNAYVACAKRRVLVSLASIWRQALPKFWWFRMARESRLGGDGSFLTG